MICHGCPVNLDSSGCPPGGGDISWEGGEGGDRSAGRPPGPASPLAVPSSIEGYDWRRQSTKLIGTLTDLRHLHPLTLPLPQVGRDRARAPPPVDLISRGGGRLIPLQIPLPHPPPLTIQLCGSRGASCAPIAGASPGSRVVVSGHSRRSHGREIRSAARTSRRDQPLHPACNCRHCPARPPCPLAAGPKTPAQPQPEALPTCLAFWLATSTASATSMRGHGATRAA